MATPQIPPRPARSTQATSATLEPEAPSPPQVPQRPAGRRHERSVSPERDRYAPSPLNAPFRKPSVDISNNTSPYAHGNASGSNLDLPRRPPSVSLPSIGQEGNEYESYSEYEAEPLSRTISAMSATQTSHVDTDLPLHAPKPGLSQSEARARVQGVTNTDNSIPSSPAGRRLSAQLDEPAYRPLKSRSSLQFRSPSAASTERPDSAHPEDHGIPKIGMQVPMYRHAGDVQAPSPAPQQIAQEGGRSRHHNRTRSARDHSNPPDSYGRHGHGIVSTDKFEKDWYAKHPEALAQEGHYSTALNGTRREYVLSSEELNKLVRGTSDAGFGTNPSVTGLPDEQIGYLASEEYASRVSSRPGSSYSNLTSPQPHQTKFDSSLRKMESRDGSLAVNELTRTTTGGSEIIHIDAPEHHWSKVTGEGVGTPPVDIGAHGGNTAERGGFFDEQGYGIPILASDQIRPDSAWQRPALEPVPHDRQGNQDLRNHFGSRPSSRPASRPVSVHGMPTLTRYDSHGEHEVHTPLDDVEEYEPLFGDDDKTQKPVTDATRLHRRPDVKHRFPSQDIWEDSPDSARLETEVGTPEAEVEDPISLSAQKTSSFESPEAESARKGEPTETDRARLISKEQRLAESDFKPRIRRDLRRPGAHRFPSSDVWEDSPDSAQLETTVGDTEDEEDEEEDPAEAAGAVVKTTTDRGDLSGSTSREGAMAGGPIIPPRPTGSSKHKSSAPKEHSHLSEVYSASTDSGQLPIAEIQRAPLESKKSPIIPDRPKPQVPIRPNRSAAATSPPEDASISKPKPPVPARPVGGKIAALQAGFMSDLNNRLKLGPQAPAKAAESDRSEDEPEEDKAPLADARKGRARGPARRKPASSAAAEPQAPAGKRMPKLSFAKPVTVWHISPKGALDVVYETPEPPAEDATSHHSTTIMEKALDSSDESHVERPVVATKSAEMPSITASATEKQDLGINPLPASSGVGNPISLPAGEPLPSTTQSINDKITLDQASYENAGAGTEAPLHHVTSRTQTGEKEIEVNPDSPEAKKMTVIEGGDAQTGETIVLPVASVEQ